MRAGINRRPGYGPGRDYRQVPVRLYLDQFTAFRIRHTKAIPAPPEVLSCHKITGAADYLLQVVSGDLDSCGEFVEQGLRVMPGVASIHSSLALREIKSSSRLPVY